MATAKKRKPLKAKADARAVLIDAAELWIESARPIKAYHAAFARAETNFQVQLLHQEFRPILENANKARLLAMEAAQLCAEQFAEDGIDCSDAHAIAMLAKGERSHDLEQQWPFIKGRLLALATTDRQSTRQCSIPSAHRSKPLTYRKAAAFLGRPNSQDSAEWLKKCIQDKTISCHDLSRQSHIFDLRQFPEEVRARMRPTQPNST